MLNLKPHLNHFFLGVMFFMQCPVFYIGGQSCGNQVMHKMQDAAKHDIFGNEIPKVNIL